MKIGIRFSLLLAILLFPPTMLAGSADPIDRLAIAVSGGERQYVFTNKEAGTYYGEVNAVNRGGWEGWFINTQRVLEDYSLQFADGTLLDRRKATTVVFPYKLVRSYPGGIRETMVMVDSINALIFEIEAPRGTRFRVTLKAPGTTAGIIKTGAAIFYSTERSMNPSATAPTWIGLSSTNGAASDSGLILDVTGGRAVAVITAGASALDAQRIIDDCIGGFEALIRARRERMDRVLASAFLETGNEEFNRAYGWAILSLDALIMRQPTTGIPTTGIFAGLPWFNNYWGRDSFISLPGATFTHGDFTDAREILLSFARFQSLDSTSSNYGRIPNLATPSSIAYNTADGTPLFVIELMNYARASGDVEILHRLYSVVRRSIEGTLRYHTDLFFFLTHGDAETWMDAAGPNGPWSPRGNRACDIQALWYRQLESATAIARLNGDSTAANAWTDVAMHVRQNFNRYFIDRIHGLVFDHLKPDGRPSDELRPNQLFCLDLLDDPAIRDTVLATVTRTLIYPFGVGSLAPADSNFHPYHHFEPVYVQDAAYHNGIVWSWLNGEAISALAARGEKDLAYRLTENMVHQILERGCVGTLSELLDACPRSGETEPRLSGAFSQAWSLAEFIRSIRESYLGIGLDAMGRRVSIEPHLPSALRDAAFNIHAGTDLFRVEYGRIGAPVRLTIQSSTSNRPYTVSLRLKLNSGRLEEEAATQLTGGHRLRVSVAGEKARLTRDGRDESRDLRTVTAMAGRITGIAFAKPDCSGDIPSLRGPSYPLLPLDDVRMENFNATILFDRQDASGDDTGPTGTYRYPQNPDFTAGILDITRTSVRYDSSHLYFRLQFRNLSNPGWHPEYGYQLTFAAIALHRGPFDTTTAVGFNSAYHLEPRYGFGRLISVGGGIRVTDESGKILCAYLPRAGDERNPIGNIGAKSVEFRIPLEYLGTPTRRWMMTVLIGGQDDNGGAGVGEFRTVEKAGGEWVGGGKENPNDPNVYDTLMLGR